MIKKVDYVHGEPRYELMPLKIVTTQYGYDVFVLYFILFIKFKVKKYFNFCVP